MVLIFLSMAFQQTLNYNHCYTVKKPINMRHYDNLVEAINGLRAEGYTYDFNIKSNSVYCKELDKDYDPNAFEVEEVLHFEGADSSPNTRSILYVIKTKSGEKGVLLEAGSIYNSDRSPELTAKLQSY